MSTGYLDKLLDLWAATVQEPSFTNHGDLYGTINMTTLGDAPWASFSVEYAGNVAGNDVPPWKVTKYNVWIQDSHTVFRNQLANPDFDGEIDYTMKQDFNANGKREWKDLMLGNWAWEQSVCTQIIFLFIGSQ